VLVRARKRVGGSGGGARLAPARSSSHCFRQAQLPQTRLPVAMQESPATLIGIPRAAAAHSMDPWSRRPMASGGARVVSLIDGANFSGDLQGFEWAARELRGQDLRPLCAASQRKAAGNFDGCTQGPSCATKIPCSSICQPVGRQWSRNASVTGGEPASGARLARSKQAARAGSTGGALSSPLLGAFSRHHCWRLKTATSGPKERQMGRPMLLLAPPALQQDSLANVVVVVVVCFPPHSAPQSIESVGRPTSH